MCTDGRTDRHEKANSRYSNFANGPKNALTSVESYCDRKTARWSRTGSKQFSSL